MPSSQNRSLPERRRRWDLIISGRDRIAANLPHLEEDLGDLESVTKQIAALAARQAYYTAKAREVTGKIRLLSRHGDRLRGRIGASLRGKHGYDAAELIQYGFNPRRPNRTLEKPTDRADPVDDYPGGSSE
jgi:hypothetical protein